MVYPKPVLRREILAELSDDEGYGSKFAASSSGATGLSTGPHRSLRFAQGPSFGRETKNIRPWGSDDDSADDSDSGIPYEDVAPLVRDLPWDAFKYSPWCHQSREEYQRWFEANNFDPQPAAIEILAESPATPTPKQWTEIPDRIRINSKPILDFLDLLSQDEPLWIPGTRSVIMSYPFKILVSCDSDIRDHCNELKASLEFAKSKELQSVAPSGKPIVSDIESETAFDTSSLGKGQQTAASIDSDVESSRSQHDDGSTGIGSNKSVQGAEFLKESPASRDEPQFQASVDAAEAEDRASREASTSEQLDEDAGSKNVAQISIELDHFTCLVDWMDKCVKPRIEAYRNEIHQKVHFRDLWILFQPGDYVMGSAHKVFFQMLSREARISIDRSETVEGNDDEEETGLWKVLVTSSDRVQLPYQDVIPFSVKVFRIGFDGTSFGPVLHTFSIRPFKGQRDVTSLEVVPLRISGCVIVDFKEAADSRAIPECSKPDLSIPTAQDPSRRKRNPHDSDVKSVCGRCYFSQDERTVDKSNRQFFLESDPFWSRFRESPLYFSSHKISLGDEELRLLPRHVPGWVLPNEGWRLLKISRLKSVETDETSWSELKLPIGHKEAILSLAQYHFHKSIKRLQVSTHTLTEFEGIRILLSGPPGVGKTFTAQSLASILSKPLYRTIPSYFGQEGEAIIRQVRQMFARSERWNCVLLIEDVDEVLARLNQNSGVERFYYELGRYDGLLLFTTRRMNTIDINFMSYMQLMLKYPFPAGEQLRDMWDAKIEKWKAIYRGFLFVDLEQTEKFSSPLWDLNDICWTGRQIENIFRSAIALAEQEARNKRLQLISLSAKHLLTAINVNMELDRGTRLPLEPPHPKPQTESTSSGLRQSTIPISNLQEEYQTNQDPESETTSSTARILCADEYLQQLFSKLLTQSILAGSFIADLGALLELLGKNLISEFGSPGDFGDRNVLSEEARKLAWAIGDHIGSSAGTSCTQARELEPAVMQQGSFSAFFESDAFEFFKEELEKVVRLKSKDPRWEMTTSDFLLRGITLEENIAHGHQSVSVIRTVRSLFQSIGLLEKPVEVGKRRVRWRCRCGKIIFDDFSENMLPRAMHDLLLHTRRMTSLGVGSTSSGEPGIISRLFTGFLRLFWTTKFSRPNTTLPFSNDQRASNRIPTEENGFPEEQIHLLICMDNGKYSSGLFQEAIHDVDCDKELFERLSKTYKQRCSKKQSFLSLRTVESIEFAIFHLILGNFADVRRHNGHCTEQRCNCLPPEEKVWPKPAAEYRYEPVPPEKSPPIGPNTLMHFMHSPNCVAEKQKWILKQFPKKIRGKLTARLDGPVTGWGIYFKEGRNKRKILFLISLNLMIIFVFGVVRSVVKKDVQGGFGIAACWITILGISLTYMDMSGV